MEEIKRKRGRPPKPKKPEELNKPKRKRGRPPKKIVEDYPVKDNKVLLYDKTKEDLYNIAFKEQLLLLRYYNQSNSLKFGDESFYQIVNIFENIYTQSKITFSDIDWITFRFPEVEYIYSLLANMIAFGGKGGKSNLNINIQGLKYDKNVYKTDYDVMVDIKNKLETIINNNKLSLLIYELAFTIIKYGFCIVYQKGTPLNIKLYKPNDIDITYDDKMQSDNLIDKLKFYDKSTGKELDKSKMYLVSNMIDTLFGKALFKDAYIYFRLLNLLENSNFIERLIKAKILYIWKVNIKDIEDPNAVSVYLSNIKNAITEKVSLKIFDENINMSDTNLMNKINVDISTALTNTHIVVPTFDKDGITIEKLQSDYKPLYQDIDRIWEKITMVSQLPKYLFKDFDAKSTPREFILIQDELVATKIYYYQAIINYFLKDWFYDVFNYLKLEADYIDIRLDEYQSVSDKRETDVDKASKYITIFTQLEQMLGIPIKTEFIIKTLFPATPIDEILDFERLNEQQQQTDITDQSNTDVLSNVLGIDTTTETLKIMKNIIQESLKREYFKTTGNIKFSIKLSGQNNG